MSLRFSELTKYIEETHSSIDIDDLRMGLQKEASAEKYEITSTKDALDKYGQRVINNVENDKWYYYGMIDKLRKPKILGMAIFDITATIIGILFLVAWTNISFAKTSIGVFMFAIFAHWYFGVDTQLGYYLGLNQQMRSVSPTSFLWGILAF